MKKLILSCIAIMAAFVCASTVNAQGFRVHTKQMGSTGWVRLFPRTSVNFVDTYDNNTSEPTITGTWKIKELKSTAEAMSAANWDMVTFGDAYPSFNAEDKITFAADGTFTPDFKSNLKNFFKGAGTYVAADEYDFHPDAVAGSATTVKMLKLKGVNRNFDATSTSEDDEAYIGYRMVEDEDADEAGVYFMEVYLLDYKSTSFAPEFEDYFFYSAEKPTAATSGMAILFTMTKELK